MDSSMINASTHPGGATALQDDTAPRPNRLAALVVGDIVSFLVFTAVGLNSHKETVSPASVVAIAAPFLIAWFVVAPFFGAFGRRASAATTRPLPLLSRTALAWVVAWPVALLLRKVLFHGDITAAFAIVAFIFNTLFLLGWRGVASFAFFRR